MTESEAWEAGRGVWRMSTEKVSRQRFALIVGEGVVRAIGEITGLSAHGDRVVLEGHVLEAGHPIRAYLGKPDPVGTGSQNPVGYSELHEERPFLLKPCGCDCGESSDRDFLPGHDVRAIQARVRAQFDGSPAEVHPMGRRPARRLGCRVGQIGVMARPTHRWWTRVRWRYMADRLR